MRRAGRSPFRPRSRNTAIAVYSKLGVRNEVEMPHALSEPRATLARLTVKFSEHRRGRAPNHPGETGVGLKHVFDVSELDRSEMARLLISRQEAPNDSLSRFHDDHQTDSGVRIWHIDLTDNNSCSEFSHAWKIHSDCDKCLRVSHRFPFSLFTRPSPDLPSSSIFIHPNLTRNGRSLPTDVVVAWTAPSAGRAQLRGRFGHGHPNRSVCGGPLDGLQWTLIQGSTELVTSITRFGQSQEFDLVHAVAEGDVIQCRVSARGDDVCDWGHLALEIELEPVFRRGEANGDTRLDVSDASFILSYLFLGGDAADSDDNGVLQTTDAVSVLQFLFLGGLPPAAPFESCGTDETQDELTCSSAPPCV